MRLGNATLQRNQLPKLLMVLSLSPGAATCCVRSIFQGMGNWGRRRSRELRGRWRLPAVLSVDKGDGSAQCSPAKPNTSPAGVSSNFASCPAVLGFFTLASLLVVVLVYLQQLRHFPSCRVVPKSPSKSAPCDGINYHYCNLAFFCGCENIQKNTNTVRKIFF